MPSVSVILPVYNAEPTIARAAQSILNQTWHDLELVVVNDGSTDATRDILMSIPDDRLRVINGERQGVAKAANLGLDHCSGRWIARMDADDFSHPARIEKQLRLLVAEELDVVGCQVRILNSDDQSIESMARYEKWINEDTADSVSIEALRFVEFPLVNPTLLARKEYFALGFENDDLPEDYDLFLRAAQQGMKFGKVSEKLFDWYDLTDGLTRTDSRYSDAAFDRCRKKHLMDGPLSEYQSVNLWGAGATGKPWLKWLQSQGLVVERLFDVSPKKMGQQIHGCLVEHPDALQQFDGNPIMIAVGRENARDLILPFLIERGFQPGLNAWFVA